MEKIPGYDYWKLATPPEYDEEEEEVCDLCGEEEYADGLCIDCWKADYGEDE